jgi:hypothetical protein
MSLAPGPNDVHDANAIVLTSAIVGAVKYRALTPKSQGKKRLMTADVVPAAKTMDTCVATGEGNSTPAGRDVGRGTGQKYSTTTPGPPETASMNAPVEEEEVVVTMGVVVVVVVVVVVLTRSVVWARVVTRAVDDRRVVGEIVVRRVVALRVVLSVMARVVAGGRDVITRVLEATERDAVVAGRAVVAGVGDSTVRCELV